MKIKKKLLRQQNRFGIGFAAGLAAGAVASGVMLFIGVVFDGISLPEVFGSVLTGLMPPSLFDYLHQTIGADAKHYLFYGILVGQCLVFALSGALFNQRANPQGRRLEWQQGSLLAFILWLFTGLLLLPVTGSGVFGANLNAGIGAGLISLAVVGVVFGLLFVLFQCWITTHMPDEDAVEVQEASRKAMLEEEDDGRLSRRDLLQR